jgi:hypothetical protein
MSLIQEALKRQQEEQGGSAEVPPAIVPPAPAGAPAPITSSEPAFVTPSAPPPGGLAASLASHASAPQPAPIKLAATPSVTPPPPLPSSPATESAPLSLATPATGTAEPAQAPSAATDDAAEGQLRHAEADKKESKPRILSSLFLMLLCLLLLCGGAVWLITWGLDKLREGEITTVPPTVVEAASSEVPAESAPAAPVDPVQELDPTQIAVEPPSATPAIATAPEVVPEPEPEVEAQPEPVTEPVPAPPVQVAEAAPVPLPAAVTVEPPPAPRPKLEWPLLTLSAIVGRGANGSALISGSILEVGEVTKGVKLVSIKSGGVWLDYKGELRFLQQGMTTDME